MSKELLLYWMEEGLWRETVTLKYIKVKETPKWWIRADGHQARIFKSSASYDTVPENVLDHYTAKMATEILKLERLLEEAKSRRKMAIEIKNGRKWENEVE